MADPLAVQCDSLSGREVVFALQRRDRPHQHSSSLELHELATPCPFCSGNEAMLPEILWQQDENGTWLCRAVTNRYPIVSPPAGHHEIIIDTPDHSLPVNAITSEIWHRILVAYRTRYCALSPDWRYLSLFRNVGKHAGGSLEHPHSQLIALRQTPRQILSRHHRLRNAYKQRGRCVLCDALTDSEETEKRLVSKSDAYVALVPEVAEVPFEVWVVPIAHSCLFSLSDKNDLSALSRILSDVFHKMTAVLGDFDHNMMLIDTERKPQPHLHWFLRIRPKTAFVGGFELSTGISVNSSRPIQDAAMLRGPTADHK